ncbi:MAG: ABC transporter permease [Alphaproteobacteria bacterium]|nr:MAG: ABC transporter permease [Alphaproteobacteria bacterium]
MTRAGPDTGVEPSRRRTARLRWLLPVLVFAAVVAGWELFVWLDDTPHYVLPGPWLVVRTLIADAGLLFSALLLTLEVTGLALVVAVIGGVGLAVLFNQFRMLELSLYPYAVILQVTPVIAIAPLIVIYVDSRILSTLICAWLVAFFPILSNTSLGLNSADHNLHDLFTIHRATRWQRLRYLLLPSALPYFLGGLRIAGGLALIGAVVAEYAVGVVGTQGGLAFRILEAGYRLNIPRMFAALLLLAAAGVVIFVSLSLLSHLLLRRWHESAVGRERER